MYCNLVLVAIHVSYCGVCVYCNVVLVANASGFVVFVCNAVKCSKLMGQALWCLCVLQYSARIYNESGPVVFVCSAM